MRKKIKLYSVPDIADQTYREDDRHWDISQLIEKAKNLPVMEIPLRHITIPILPWEITDYRTFIVHMQRVNKADLKFPIILDDQGYIMDGFHRLAKALIVEKETIKAVRFDYTPTCTYIKED